MDDRRRTGVLYIAAVSYLAPIHDVFLRYVGFLRIYFCIVFVVPENIFFYAALPDNPEMIYNHAYNFDISFFHRNDGITPFTDK